MVKQAELTKVLAKYPEYASMVRTPAFSYWLSCQEPRIQSLTSSESAKDAIFLLDSFWRDGGMNVLYNGGAKNRRQPQSRFNRKLLLTK